MPRISIAELPGGNMCRKRIQRQNENVPGAREKDRQRGRRASEGEKEEERERDS